MTRFTLALLLLICHSVCAQNGKITYKKEIELKSLPMWDNISEGGELKPEFSHLEKLNYYSIFYQSDSLQVPGYVFEPKASGKYPVVIFNRGGNRNFAPLNHRTMIGYTSKLASEGYIILASNYRDADEFGGADVNDVLNLIETAKQMPAVDADRIGMFGWSRGGMMTYLALQKSDQIKSAIIGNGCADLFTLIKARPKFETNVLANCIPNYDENKQAALIERSPIYWPEKLHVAPLLLLCGTRDNRVSFTDAEAMTKKLETIDYPVNLKTFDTDHFFSDKKAELNREIIDWFNSHL